jgi:membrane-associated phospholipid phosphatase
MTSVQKWFVALAGTTLTVVTAYLWIDRPLALLMRGLIARRETFDGLTHVPDPVIPTAIVVFIVAGLAAMSNRVLTKLQTTMLLCSVSALIAESTKTALKFVFGRTWPDTWINNNPSFLRNGVYGFNLFHSGTAYSSFPSGHLTVTAAVVSVLWIAYPKWRALYALAALAVAVGLVGANYHFFSDVIAGGFVGTSTGWMVATLWKMRTAQEPPR